MKELILVSHGEFCVGLKKSVEMILGPQERIHTVPLFEEEGEMDFLAKFDKIIASFDNDYSVFADLLGGTPCNVIAKKIMAGSEIELYAGMNMPMVIAYLNAQMLDVSFDLVSAHEGIVDVSQHVKNMDADDEE